MILVLLGTFHIEFHRPLLALQKLCEEGKLSEQIIVQSGYTQFTSPFFEIRPFLSPDALDELYDSASLIITHAGTGSIIKALKKNKKVIAIARLFKNGEHIDDHQLEILNEFASSGYILPWHENDSIEQLLDEIKYFEPKPYISKKRNIIEFLKTYIDNLN